MKKILRWKDERGDTYWDISTQKQKLAAFLQMFQIIDENHGYPLIDGSKESKEHVSECAAEIASLGELKRCLEDGKVSPLLKDDAEHKVRYLERRERELKDLQWQCRTYTKAKRGDSRAAYLLIDDRSSYVNEGYYIEDVTDPLKENAWDGERY